MLSLRGNSYEARIHLGPQQYLWRTLKTNDLETAKRLGLKLLHEIEFKQQHGLVIQDHSLAEVIDEYVALRQRQHDRGALKQKDQNYTSVFMLRQIKRVVKFWREYAGDKPVSSIGDAQLKGYVDWRRSYYRKFKVLPKNAKLHPTDKTMLWEMTLGRTLLKYATERGYRGNVPMPNYRFKLKVHRIRPAFTAREIEVLLETLEAWITACKNDQWRYTRILLRNYVQVLLNSGMRVGEANNLRRRDASTFTDTDGRTNYRFLVRGKTGEREVILRNGALKYINLALAINQNHSADAWLFCMRDGSKIITLIDQFDKVLELAGITYDSKGYKFSLYSLRHTYAVDAIRRGISAYEIVRNMGTSLEILQKYYAKHALTSDTATRLGN